MIFTVYAYRKNRGLIKMAETRYKEDATAVLNNHHSGYISQRGVVVFTKNYDSQETTKENQ